MSLYTLEARGSGCGDEAVIDITINTYSSHLFHSTTDACLFMDPPAARDAVHDAFHGSVCVCVRPYALSISQFTGWAWRWPFCQVDSTPTRQKLNVV